MSRAAINRCNNPVPVRIRSESGQNPVPATTYKKNDEFVTLGSFSDRANTQTGTLTSSATGSTRQDATQTRRKKDVAKNFGAVLLIDYGNTAELKRNPKNDD